MTAMVMSKFMSGRSRRSANQPLGATYHAPATMAAPYTNRAISGTACASPAPSEPSADATSPATAT